MYSYILKVWITLQIISNRIYFFVEFLNRFHCTFHRFMMMFVVHFRMMLVWRLPCSSLIIRKFYSILRNVMYFLEHFCEPQVKSFLLANRLFKAWLNWFYNITLNRVAYAIECTHFMVWYTLIFKTPLTPH